MPIAAHVHAYADAAAPATWQNTEAGGQFLLALGERRHGWFLADR